MPDPTTIDPTLDARLKVIEAQQGAAAKRQAEIEAEQKRQAAAFAQTLDLLQDNNDAILHLQKYVMHFLLETIEQSMMLNSATTKFAAFLNLPATSSKLNQYLDVAFTLLATAFPVLRLTGLLEGVTKNATLAVEIAKAAETKAPALATVVTSLPKAHEYADVIKKANDTRMKALVALKSDPSANAANALSKLDASKAAIKSLAAAANQAVLVFDKVADAIGAEFKSRLATPGKAHKKSILQIAQDILTPPNFPTQSELDMIETRYLWEMITAYCRQNVTIVDSNLSSVVPQRIEGLNDTQLDTMYKLFGPGVPRGTHFPVPPFPYRNMYLQLMGVNTRTDYIQLRAG
jgi:hypothetical protein